MDGNPRFSYTAEEEPERQCFLREHPGWDCKRDAHMVGEGAMNLTGPAAPAGYVFKGFTATGCCWVCGKAVC